MVLTAKDILEKDFLSLPAATSALEAAKLMKSQRHGFVVVVDEASKPVGIVTEWDYMSKVTGEGKDPQSLKLEDLMSTNIVWVKPETDMDSIAQIMSDKGIRRLLVMKEGRVLGVITCRTVLTRLREYIDRISSQIARLQSPRI
jgi:CBS domain-containing protein